MKTNNYLLKVPLDIWVNAKKKKRHENVKPLRRSSLPSNKDKWQKWETQVTLRESCNFGEVWQGNWTTYNWAPRNSFDLTAVQGTATFSASCLSRFPLKGGSPVFIHEDSSQLGMKWGLKERNYRKATALSLLSPSLPEATLLPSCEVEEVGKGHGAGAATASGLSVPPWVQAHVSISNWPLEDRWSRTHLFVYDKRKREIALIELGIIRQSNYRLMKWRKWGNTHLEVGK